MKDELSKGFIEQKVADGEFGEYLQFPMTNKQRAEVVGRKMLLCRKNSGLSQGDVCSIIGLAPQTYSGYENGKHEPTLETLVRLSHLYRVTLDFLLDKNGDDDSKGSYEEYENLYENEKIKNLSNEMILLKEEMSELRRRLDRD